MNVPVETAELIQKECQTDVKVYKRRWVILFIFILYALGNSFQWVEYSIVTNLVIKYYNVSSLAVDWSSLVYLSIYPVLLLPASYIIETQVSTVLYLSTVSFLRDFKKYLFFQQL